MRKIPLYDRGGVIKDYALVSDQDYDSLIKYKWHMDFYGYVQRDSLRISGKKTSIKMQRQIMGTPRGMDTDHINRNKLDNRRENLRVCTRSQNNVNSRLRKDNKSGHRGVSWVKGREKWRVAITPLGGKTLHVGYFDKKMEAVKAYELKANELFGEFLPRQYCF